MRRARLPAAALGHCRVVTTEWLAGRLKAPGFRHRPLMGVDMGRKNVGVALSDGDHLQAQPARLITIGRGYGACARDRSPSHPPHYVPRPRQTGLRPSPPSSRALPGTRAPAPSSSATPWSKGAKHRPAPWCARWSRSSAAFLACVWDEARSSSCMHPDPAPPAVRATCSSVGRGVHDRRCQALP